MSRRNPLGIFLAEENLGDEAKDFLESLKTHEYHLLDPSFNERIRVVNSSKEIGGIIASHTFELGTLPQIPLAPLDLENPGLRALVEQGVRRSSQRQYGEPLPFATVSQLLQTAYFNKNNVSLPDGVMDPAEQQQLRFKNIASGGGLYTVEVYYLSLRTDGLASGVYHYNLNDKTLEQVRVLDTDDDILKMQGAFFGDKRSNIDFDHASGIVVMAGIINRASFKYGNRAIALAYIDAGAIIHNLYTVSNLLGIGCCGNGGFLDDTLRTYLNLRTTSQVILGSVIVGSPV
ncbi:SagB/ThcOx family dehydrogenase [Fibrella sp. WM1]|uniref:SagB/ThcOx family dehydrogenase n=1 Tax=Fibrella musci TaxID=3242485 RepID=UPI003522BD1B